MIQSVEPQDRLVEEYLAAVGRACVGVPATRREELVADLREHIAVARARLDRPSEADIRTILDRLGEPEVIAAEARVGEPARPMRTGSVGLAAPPARPGPVWPIVIITGAVFILVLVALAIGLVVLAVSPGPQ
jgi:uncharacterized membrane protein